MTRWLKPASLLVAATVVATLGLQACTEETEDPVASLTISVSPRTLKADGRTADVTIKAFNADGSAGQGSVAIDVTAGSLDEAGSAAGLELANGSATIKWGCIGSSCVGVQKLTATWDTVSATTRVEFYVEPGLDAGVPDAAEPQNEDAGVPTGYSITATADHSRLFFGVGDNTMVTATLLHEGVPVPGKVLQFSSTLAKLSAGDPRGDAGTGTTLLEVVTATTDEDGIARVWLHEAGNLGESAVTVRYEDLTKAIVMYEVVNVQQLTWTSTICNGQPCQIMGVKGSGFNEQAQVSFKVVDSLGTPAYGVPVSFHIANPPPGVNWSRTALTNAEGIATANLSSGKVIGAFSVRAIVLEGQVEAESPTIGIRGAKPSNWGFTLRCSRYNVGAYVSALPPADIDVECSVKVVDRYNNPVGTGTPVNFKSEVGAITNATATTAYLPEGNNAMEGTGLVTFSTIGAWPPVDVEPLEVAAQWPQPRLAEPRIVHNGTTQNPRDGFVTIIAYVRGEEYFVDNNSNGEWDVGEPFIDTGEPFVDSNDNGIWDRGELFIDEAPADGKWNPPNGRWDNNTTIWTETRILYTGSAKEGKAPDGTAYSEITPLPMTDTCPPTGSGGLKAGERVNVTIRFADERLNRPPTGSMVRFRWDGYWELPDYVFGWGTVQELHDSFGFGWGRYLIDASNATACNAASTSCQWKLLFFNWDRGFVVNGDLNGDRTRIITGGESDAGHSGYTYCYTNDFSATMSTPDPEDALVSVSTMMRAPASFSYDLY